MSKYNVGDEFKIVIDEVFKGKVSGNDKYRVKGFDNLIFDDKGLDKLIPVYVKKQRYAFVCSVKLRDNQWTDEKIEYQVETQDLKDSICWHILDLGYEVIGATVVIVAKSHQDADKIMSEEIKRRNAEIKGEI